MIPFPFILVEILKFFMLVLNEIRQETRNSICDLLPPNLQIINALRHIVIILKDLQQKKRKKTKPHKLIRLLRGYRYGLHFIQAH